MYVIVNLVKLVRFETRREYIGVAEEWEPEMVGL